MLRLGLSSGALYPDTVTEDAPARAAAWGFRDLELLLQTAGEYQPAFLDDTGSRAAALGVRIHAIHVNQTLHPLLSPYQRRLDEGRALFQQAIEGAARVGAGAVVWHGLTRQEAAEADAWDRFFATTRELAAACRAAGVTLAIENVSWCALATVRDLLSFAPKVEELAPEGGLGFTFDPFQAAEAGANPLLIVAAMEPHLRNVHLSDHRHGHRHLVPGEGDLPWPALIRAIAATGYAGPMMLEAPLRDDVTIARTRAVLEPAIAAATDPGDACAGGAPAGVREGIRLFNARLFYEAHEAIEHEWHAERRPVRRLYQGVLQIGVGLHHARSGNHRGAVLLLTDGIAKCREFLPACQGIDTERLVRESAVCLTWIETQGPGRLDAFPWEIAPLVRSPGGAPIE